MIEENVIHEKAERIRDVIRYLRKFKNALVIIYLDDSLIDSPVFMNHIKDICLIHESGLNVIIVPGSARRIDQVLTSANIKWTIHNDCRITTPEAMPLIKMAAFDVSNQVMTALAGEKKTALIGNWVRARGKGVINGFDYGTSGEIDKLQTDAIKTVLNDGFIPIMPCIGWSQAGKPYNISSIQLAQQIASHLNADKLFYLVPDAAITTENFNIPGTIGLSTDGTVPAMNLEELELFLKTNDRSFSTEDENTTVHSLKESAKISTEPSVVSNDSSTNLENKPSVSTINRSVTDKNQCSKQESEDKSTNELSEVSQETNEHSVNFNNQANNRSVISDNNVPKDKIYSLLKLANKACNDGVSRVHILDGSLEGIIPCEIFSDLGSGTMIYRNNYGGLRDMKQEDIPDVMKLIQPFVEAGILLPRTKQIFSETYQNYIVYELDGAIRACSSLVPYPDGQMEIAAVAVDKTYSHIGIGPKMIEYLVSRATKAGAKSVFLLTTQTADWFENLGFKPAAIETLPPQRKAIWTPDRGSKLLRITL